MKVKGIVYDNVTHQKAIKNNLCIIPAKGKSLVHIGIKKPYWVILQNKSLHGNLKYLWRLIFGHFDPKDKRYNIEFQFPEKEVHELNPGEQVMIEFRVHKLH